jgi:hypothetical protein
MRKIVLLSFHHIRGGALTKKKIIFPKMTIHKPNESPCRVDKKNAIFLNSYVIIRPKKRMENGQICR